MQENGTKAKSRDLIAWEKRLEVRIPVIDTQHKKLVQLINNLHRAMKQGEGRWAVGRILGELADYTVTHFADEEELMKTHGYPGLAGHQKAHKALVAKVIDYKSQFESGQGTVSMDLMEFLKDWLIDHITGTDMEYSSHLREKMGLR